MQIVFFFWLAIPSPFSFFLSFCFGSIYLVDRYFTCHGRNINQKFRTVCDIVWPLTSIDGRRRPWIKSSRNRMQHLPAISKGRSTWRSSRNVKEQLKMIISKKIKGPLTKERRQNDAKKNNNKWNEIWEREREKTRGSMCHLWPAFPIRKYVK
jgi:hypothetical protein